MCTFSDSHRRRHGPTLPAVMVAAAATLAALGCTCPAARPKAHAAAAVVHESPTRSARTLCDGKPCMLTVEVSGNRQVPASVLFASMRSIDDVDFNEEAIERDALMIAAIYYDRGYLSVKVSPPEITRAEGTVRVRFSIEEGPQYTIRSLEVYEDVAAVRKPPLGGWKSSFKVGDLFRRREFAIDLQWLRRIYHDEGYADVQADPETDLDEANRQIAVVVPIVRGAIASFGRIRFDGLKRVAEEDVRKEISLHEGERFSMTALENSLKHLRKVGWFYRVEMSTASGGPAVVDVTIEVTERVDLPANQPSSPSL